MDNQKKSKQKSIVSHYTSNNKLENNPLTTASIRVKHLERKWSRVILVVIWSTLYRPFLMVSKEAWKSGHIYSSLWIEDWLLQIG